MSSVFGEKVKISVFGQSRSEAVGAVIDSPPAGFGINKAALCAFMERRRPSLDISTPRCEPDEVEFISGITGGVTNGSPLCVIIKNRDTDDTCLYTDTPRPGHADYTQIMKYGKCADIAGGGHASGRLTAALCAAGGILSQLLTDEGIEFFSRIYSVGGVCDSPLDCAAPDTEALRALRASGFPTLSHSQGELMQELIRDVKKRGDTVGCVVECFITGLRAGVGEPVFSGLENQIARAAFAIPSVKGIEFGSGFAGAMRYGSENNDPFYMDCGKIKTKTNNCGGILGGISDGMPVVFRIASKPVPSIMTEQDTVNLSSGADTKLTVSGRCDACTAPRIAVCAEACAAIAVYELYAAYLSPL